MNQQLFVLQILFHLIKPSPANPISAPSHTAGLYTKLGSVRLLDIRFYTDEILQDL